MRGARTQLTNQDLDNNAKGFMNVREALGRTSASPSSHWELDWEDALRLARAVAPMRPEWLEDALPPDFCEAWVKLTEESPVPILTGENLCTRRGFLPFIVHQDATLCRSTFRKPAVCWKRRRLPT